MLEYNKIHTSIDTEWMHTYIPECWLHFVPLKAEYYKGSYILKNISILDPPNGLFYLDHVWQQ